MKNILLIGGAGYIGTVLSSHFLKLGFNVSVLDNFIYNNQFAIQSFLGDENYSFFYGDFGKTELLKNAAKDADYVVILGGLVGDPITKKYPKESIRINEFSVRSCIDFFDDKQIEKLVFISTCSNYGLIKEDELANEDFELNPLSLYAKSKVNSEKYLLSKKDNVSYSGVILRFATAFGLSPRMRFDLSVSEFVRDIYFGKELNVFDENTWRPYCHVRDFARIIEIILNSDNNKIHFEVFNAGGEINNFTKKMIIDEIISFIPGAKVVFSKHGSDPRNYKVSFNKIKSVLNYEPVFSVTHGIEELIQSFDIGLYKDSILNKNKYGNYEIFYKLEM